MAVTAFFGTFTTTKFFPVLNSFNDRRKRTLKLSSRGFYETRKFSPYEMAHTFVMPMKCIASCHVSLPARRTKVLVYSSAFPFPKTAPVNHWRISKCSVMDISAILKSISIKTFASSLDIFISFVNFVHFY